MGNSVNRYTIKAVQQSTKSNPIYKTEATTQYLYTILTSLFRRNVLCWVTHADCGGGGTGGGGATAPACLYVLGGVCGLGGGTGGSSLLVTGVS